MNTEFNRNMEDMQRNIYSELCNLNNTLRQKLVPLLEQGTINSYRIIELLEKTDEKTKNTEGYKTAILET